MNQTKGLKRNTIDKYYTKENVVELCINQINKDDFIIEPSAGNGSFMAGIKSLTHHFHFYDIEPNNIEIIKQDYLHNIMYYLQIPIQIIYILYLFYV